MTQNEKSSINVQTGDKEARDRQLFDSIAAKYAKKDSVRSSAIVRKYQLYRAIEPLLKSQNNLGTIIEIACGIGAPARYLDNRYDRYIGIDYSDQMIAAARAFNRENDKATFMAGNIKSVGRIETKADLILAIGALHHMTDHAAVFESLRHMANPGAHFIAIEPNRGNFLIQRLRALRAKIDKGYSAEQHFYLASELRQLAVSGGLLDITVVPQGYFSPPIAQVIIQPQFITAPLSALLVAFDKMMDNGKSSLLTKLSWNLILRAKFPD